MSHKTTHTVHQQMIDDYVPGNSKLGLSIMIKDVILCLSRDPQVTSAQRGYKDQKDHVD